MNQIDLNGQTAIVTGGAQGIGLAVAERFVASGAKVAIWDMDAALGAESAKKLGGISVKVDISDWPSVEKAMAETEKALGPVSILVNSAGIAGPSHELCDYPADAWKQVIDIDLNGTFHTNKAVVPGMKARNYGRIVNIASIAGKEGNPRAAAYSAAKAGVIGLTKSLCKELAEYDIAVNCVTPVTAATRILDQVDQAFIDYMRSKIPRGRFIKVEEIAAMVAWMCSEESNFTTGAVFDLSGGRATY
jgi:3-oxoacyl-[acyl-carrier protein] reductase